MNRYQSLAIYGSFITITGIIIVSLAYNPSRTIQYIVTAGLYFSALFALITAYNSDQQLVPLKYHALQGFGLIAYALTILVYATTLDKFLNATVYFLLFFGLTEIIGGFQLLKFTQKISLQLIIYRMVIGFVTAFGAVLILATSYHNPNNALLGSGIAFIFGGSGFILFASLIRKLQIQIEQS